MTRPTWNVSGTWCLVLGTLTFLSQDTKVLSTNVLSTLSFMHRITLIPGDGIGPEVASAVVRIVEASGAQIEWETKYAGAQALEKFGSTLPEDLLESILRNKVA